MRSRSSMYCFSLNLWWADDRAYSIVGRLSCGTKRSIMKLNNRLNRKKIPKCAFCWQTDQIANRWKFEKFIVQIWWSGSISENTWSKVSDRPDTCALKSPLHGEQIWRQTEVQWACQTRPKVRGTAYRHQTHSFIIDYNRSSVSIVNPIIDDEIVTDSQHYF